VVNLFKVLRDQPVKMRRKLESRTTSGFLLKDAKRRKTVTDKLPEKIIKIETLRINRDIYKRCRCAYWERKYEVDPQNREVTCKKCGSRVDPFDAIYDMAKHYERLEEEVQRLLEQRKEIINYKPHMIVFRNLESNYRGKKMLPSCPHCHRGFFFEEIVNWTNREIEERRRLLDE
jgi:hypothetical protein